MTVLLYSCVEIISLSLFYIGDKYESIKSYTRIIAFAIMFLIIGFRDITVGIDYRNYSSVILSVAGGDPPEYFKNWLSIGFIYIIKFFQLFGIPQNILPTVVIAFIGFLTLVFYYKSFDELSVNSTVSLYLFFCFCLYFQLMNQFRQMLAVAIVLYSFKYIDKSFFKYCVWILIAASIHKSAIIMLPIYFIVKLKLSKRTLIGYAILGGSMIVFYPFLRSLIQYTSYSGYLGWTQYDIGATTTSVLNLVVRIAMLFGCLPFMNQLIKENSKNRALYHLVLICTVLQILVINVNLFGRITTYFFVFYILLIPQILNQIKNKVTVQSRIIVNFIFVFIFLIYQVVYYISQSATMGYSVYKFL